MNAVRRFIALCGDSPTYGRDRASLLSGFSIGTAALLLNGAVLMLVLPLMLEPDDRDFVAITENLEFGQLLALILLGGAAAFATVLIPLRMVSVFWGPRMGRYFDQVVLSGISPLRFVIGKVTSQNLFVALTLFLLLPYLVLSLTLGGVDPVSFVAGLFLIWLYCMALSLVTLWMSLYFNELLAAAMVIWAASAMSIAGCAPIPIQPFVLTPFPTLVHPILSSMPSLAGQVPPNFGPVFLSCALGLTAVICVATCAISLGPLYGIIRENSTFGEVVRTGDSKRKRWFRLRLHIQRPSEIAFFYENRGELLRRWEGLIRWGTGLFSLLLVSGAATGITMYFLSTIVVARGVPGGWFAYEFHTVYLVIHGVGLVLSVLLFSHARNTTYLRIPFAAGRTATVSTLDTLCFLLFLTFSTTVAVATPYYFERFLAPLGGTVFPAAESQRGRQLLDFQQITREGTLGLSLAAMTLYALHRLGCLVTWLKSLSFVGMAGVYFIGICMVPFIIGAISVEVNVAWLEAIGPTVALISPITLIGVLFGELGEFSSLSTAPFFITHGILFALAVLRIRRNGPLLKNELYLAQQESA